MKIAVLGGSFDPPHLGHVIIAKQVKEFFGIDQIWLMPSFLHPFNKKLSPYKNRLAMTKYLDNGDIKVSDFEIKRKKISYTIDTLNALAKLYPKYKFYWIIGSDQLDSFPKWKNWKEIINKYNLIVFPRDIDFIKLEEKIKKTLNIKTMSKNILIPKSKDIIVSNISSTKVRERMSEGKEIKDLVPKGVEEYIIKHGLYK